MPIEGVLNARVPVKLWTDLNGVESEALDQLKNVANLPFVFKHVAVMADCHSGKGATIGSVIATTKEDIEKQLGGIECRKDLGIIDELPGAYKPIEEVMLNQADLVETVEELKQCLCIKG